MGLSFVAMADEIESLFGIKTDVVSIGTDLSLVWNVIKNELPTFEKDLKRIWISLDSEGR